MGGIPQRFQRDNGGPDSAWENFCRKNQPRRSFNFAKSNRTPRNCQNHSGNKIRCFRQPDRRCQRHQFGNSDEKLRLIFSKNRLLFVGRLIFSRLLAGWLQPSGLFYSAHVQPCQLFIFLALSGRRAPSNMAIFRGAIFSNSSVFFLAKLARLRNL